MMSLNLYYTIILCLLLRHKPPAIFCLLCFLPRQQLLEFQGNLDCFFLLVVNDYSAQVATTSSLASPNSRSNDEDILAGYETVAKHFVLDSTFYVIKSDLVQDMFSRRNPPFLVLFKNGQALVMHGPHNSQFMKEFVRNNRYAANYDIILRYKIRYCHITNV